MENMAVVVQLVLIYRAHQVAVKVPKERFRMALVFELDRRSALVPVVAVQILVDECVDGDGFAFYISRSLGMRSEAAGGLRPLSVDVLATAIKELVSLSHKQGKVAGGSSRGEVCKRCGGDHGNSGSGQLNRRW